jgi:hypothetical protein
MNIKKLIAITILVIVPSFASASLITFDGQGGGNNYFDSPYSEGGFLFTLVGGNPAATDPHFGDGGNVGTLWWHDGGSNPGNAMVRMTRVDGGIFNLFGFDLIGSKGIIVSARGYTSIRSTAGSIAASFRGITSATFDFSGRGPNAGAIDNINVPEPGVLALLGLGLAGLGFARRKTKA